MAEPQSAADTTHTTIKHTKMLPHFCRGGKVVMQWSDKINGFLLLFSQGGNSCKPQWDGVKGVGKSVVRQY